MGVFSSGKSKGKSGGLVFGGSSVRNEEEQLQGRIGNYETRFSAIGAKPPEPKKESNFLLKALDILDRPRNAILSGLTGQGFTKGLTGKTKVNVSDLLKDKVDNKYLRGGLGFVGDVLLDPLTYLTVGTAGVAKGAAQQGAKKYLKFAGQPLADVTGASKAIGKGFQKTGLPEILGPVFSNKYIRRAVTADDELPDIANARDAIEGTRRLIKGQQQEALDKYKGLYKGLSPEASAQAANIIEAPTLMRKILPDILQPKPKVTVSRSGSPASIDDMLTSPPPLPKQPGVVSRENALSLPTPGSMAGAKITQRVPGLSTRTPEGFQVKPRQAAETGQPSSVTGVRVSQAVTEPIIQSVRRGNLDKAELSKALSQLDSFGQKQLLDDIADVVQNRLPDKAQKVLFQSQIPKATYKGQRFSEKELLAYRKQIDNSIDDLNKGMAKYMRDSVKEAAKEGDIYRQIRNRGGIRMSESYKEVYKGVPLGLRNKYGSTVDEMASDLGMGADDLLQSLTGRMPLAVPKISAFIDDAVRLLEKDPEYQTKLLAVAKIDDLLTKLAPGKIPSEIKALLPRISKADDVLLPEVRAQVDRFIANPTIKPVIEQLRKMENVSLVTGKNIAQASPKIQNLDIPVNKNLQVGFEKKPIEATKPPATTTTEEMFEAARKAGISMNAESRAAARIAKQLTEETARKDLAVGVQFTELPNYVRHLYKDDPQKVQQVLNQWAKDKTRLPGRKAGFQKERKLPTIAEAKSLGLTPIEDVRILTAVRELEGIQQRGIQSMYRELEKIGQNVVRDMKDAPAGWKALPGIKQLEGKAVHPETARFLERFNSTVNSDEGMRTFLSVLGGVQNFWKGLVTAPNPAFHIRNAMGNVFNNFLAGVVNPNVYRLAGIVQKGGSEIVTLNGQQYTAKELRKIFRENGLEGFGFFAGETSKSMLREATEAFGKQSLKDKFNPIQAGRKIGDKVETNAKMAHFIDRLNKGDSAKDAAESVRKYLFDYGDLTQAEKKIRDFVPFYTFTRKNLPLQLENLITNPGKMTAVNKLMENAKSVQGTQEGDMPGWMKSELAIPLGNNKSLMLDLPMNQLNMVGGGETLKNALGMISPLAKVPIELAMGRQIFSGAPIEKYPGATARFGNLPLPANVAYGLSQLGPMPRTAADIAGSFIDQQPSKGAIPPPPKQIPMLGSFIRQTNPERERLLGLTQREQQLADYRRYIEEVLGGEVPTLAEIEKKKKKGRVF